ncbi:ImmA/IrrE family metallo-endopeptidase [Streptomyces sp. ATCC51928]|uniref:Helix-turn-helix domain-containing protein n=1 Tax=Streptomyces caviscabies TaxID=90079 RepID=A0ABW2MHF6_9ACTN|nr:MULTISPECIES: ImmA/IrrE family metallo-endopeptidase [unclassified Streptomyces]MDX3500558.1 ImmA/IrrE family metallo-endopeptidase [Streptomyces sp. ATCC51928]MDX5520619.1 ImmA/IrrE family metallo-endopeptidase [Streptomyces sp. DE06-01C]
MISSSRIALARKRRGLTLAELGDLADVSVQSLSNYERGRTEPTSETLSRLSSALRFPESFFYAAEIDLIEPDNVSFRARSKLTAGPRDGALAASRLALELNDWIERRYKLPENKLPSLGQFDPETAAEVLRARWGLDSSPISNMVHLLEAHGVRVFSLPPEYKDVDAFSMWRDGTPFVFLNTLKTPERGRFDAAHELAHLILHGEENLLVGPQAERDANAFASAFLMPKASIMARMQKTPMVSQIVKAKSVWMVSAMALTYRLHELDMLSDWHYRRACVDLGKRGFRTGEPNGLPAREKSQLLEKVFKMTQAKNSSLRDVAQELHVSSEELSSWVFGLVFTVRSGDKSGKGIREVERPRLSLVR